jgi:hypothetical protein
MLGASLWLDAIAPAVTAAQVRAIATDSVLRLKIVMFYLSAL